MKKQLTLLLCITVACAAFAACGSNYVTDNNSMEMEEEMSEVTRDAEKITEVDEDKLERAGTTLEDRLSLLKKDGWKKSGSAYVYTTSEEDCNGEYAITAKGNNADVTVSFDYFDDNEDMIDFYKEDPGMGQAVCAYWYMRAVAVLDAPLGSTKYSLNVSDTEVVSGSMTYAEAERIYDEYYED